MPAPMPLRARLQAAQANIVQPTSIPAPITGWNTRDALDAMEPTDAVLLDNWYPDAGGLNLRNGYASYATGMGSNPIKTLAEYNSGSTRKFLAATSGKFFDISSSGVVGAALATGFTSDIWQWATFLGKTFFVNGADTAQIYDGSSFAGATFTGVTLSTLIGVVEYQQRLFFWQNNSTGFWYAQLNSISGALAFYDLGAFCPRGGNVMAATTFSHDGGNGVFDAIAFIMTSGDVLIFFGNDPSTSATWQMIGRYRISPPVSPRAVCGYGADSYITTFDDHLPLQQQLVALKVGQMPPRSKVSTAVQTAVAANQSGFGWQALYYTRGRRLIFNIPNVDGTFDQHVQNTALGAWCRFTNMNAYCWGLYKDFLYFGGASGVVYLADTGSEDNGGAVIGNGQQAWNTFNNPMRKRVSAVRPVVEAVGQIQYEFGLGFDYGAINISEAVATANQGSPWDTSPWDTTPWSPEPQIDPRWRIGGGSGVAISLQLNVAGLEAISWLRTDMRFEPGTAL